MVDYNYLMGVCASQSTTKKKIRLECSLPQSIENTVPLLQNKNKYIILQAKEIQFQVIVNKKVLNAPELNIQLSNLFQRRRLCSN